MAAVSVPIIAALFQRGAFDAAATSATAAALVAYAAGLPAFVLVKALVPGFFARGDTATPVKVAVGVVALNLALNLALTPFLSHVGIALATSAAAWINVGLLAWLLMRRGQLVLDRRLRRVVPRLLLAALLMTAALLGLDAALVPPSGGLARVAALAALIAMGLATYFGAAQLLGGMDLRQVVRMLRRR
jgi:putative peptidoglycan lipid II flippase